MARYITKRCPHCRTVYIRNMPQNMPLYGSPVRVCKTCNKTFIDKDFQELSITGMPSDYEYPDVGTTMFSLLIPIILAAVFITKCIMKYSTTLLVLSIISVSIIVIMLVIEFSPKSLSKTKQKYDQEYEASKKRMQDPEYVEILKKIGYPIHPGYRTR